jgi:hypothetical protein
MQASVEPFSFSIVTLHSRRKQAHDTISPATGKTGTLFFIERPREKVILTGYAQPITPAAAKRHGPQHERHAVVLLILWSEK